ncbi:hypothetical protein E3N88_28388 [Mikania micrantha]|uniref:Reverse transcriptase domain-containing protein n=1 Tax=Mikania micrantha TaxID=192012 RepID=A0A5N6N0I1_9ASTR|nr:hypothetical protein E3N88_28388 [Mikania micrantha]
MFTIPCLFGDDVRRYALADSGASINLMPYSLYEKLALGDLSPTRMTLSLADRSVKCPRGILKNVLVKVDRFVFPVDFVVMDMEVDTKVPIILGRPFLRTAKAIIDVYEGKLTFRVGDESVCLKIAKAMKVDGELVHQVEDVNLVNDDIGVDGDEFMGEGPWNVGDSGSNLMVFNHLDAGKMEWRHQKFSGKMTTSRYATKPGGPVALRETFDLMCMFVACRAELWIVELHGKIGTRQSSR